MAGKYIPKPFKRPSISLDKPTKQWQEVPATALSYGDVIPDFGAITQGGRTDDGVIWYTNQLGDKRLLFLPNELVFAFTAGR